MGRTHKTVSVIMTVKNEPAGCALTLDSLLSQTRRPDEIIVVDGGSNDETVDVIRRYAAANPTLHLIEAPGVNIARGRNIAA
ncbi:MAG: glycosyltransferase, partial [Phycisphaerales bacterium]